MFCPLRPAPAWRWSDGLTYQWQPCANIVSVANAPHVGGSQVSFVAQGQLMGNGRRSRFSPRLKVFTMDSWFDQLPSTHASHVTGSYTSSRHIHLGWSTHQPRWDNYFGHHSYPFPCSHFFISNIREKQKKKKNQSPIYNFVPFLLFFSSMLYVSIPLLSGLIFISLAFSQTALASAVLPIHVVFKFSTSGLKNTPSDNLQEVSLQPIWRWLK